MKRTITPETNVKLIDEEVDDILSTLPTELASVVELPSRGVLYEEKTSSVTVKPLTFEDEKFLLTAKNNPTIDPINSILDRCVKGIDVKDLLMMDKMAIIMTIRELSYGSDYSFSITCQGCGFVNPLTLDLTTLPVTCLEEDAEEPFEVELPLIKRKVKVRFPRVRDEKYFKEETGILDNLWRFVMEIDGNTKATVISKVIPKLVSADLHTIVKAISATNYGVDTSIDFTCHNCRLTTHLELPITENFFSVS
jgi:hypothetical protein